MNGGSDLYLEYGFEKLITRDIKYKDESYTVDIYEMPSPENAFGIYSLHTFRCMRADTLSFFNCLSAYQYQAAIDNKYISIVFQSGSGKARRNADELLFLYADTLNARKVLIPAEINKHIPFSSSVKYLKGNLSISNAQPSLLQWMEGIAFSGIWLVNDNISKNYNALIHPTDDENMDRLKDRIPKENIISADNGSLYVKCPEKEETDSHGSFGF
ncbi:hypothetical protein D0T84_11590 [Dysgonomonas sp. 521]|nr:hypothetical protein [Dysgonomonas sp. 521]